MSRLAAPLRGLAFALYMLQAGVLAPLHERAEMAPAPAGPGLALAAACDATSPCHDRAHRHPCGPGHRAEHCTACAVAGRVAALAQPLPGLAALATVLLVAPTSGDRPAGVGPHVTAPRGPPSAS